MHGCQSRRRSEAGSDAPTLQCRLDSQQPTAFTACTSPRIASGLQPGSHIFEVRAIDAAGNVDQTPAVWTWVITAAPADTTAPQTTIDQSAAAHHDAEHERDLPLLVQRDRLDVLLLARRRRLHDLLLADHAQQLHGRQPHLRRAGQGRCGQHRLDPGDARVDGSAPPAPNCGTQQTVSANADSWIVQNDPSKNNGNDSNLKVMSKSGNSNIRALVSFNLPTVPAGCVIDTATLRLYSTGYKTGRTMQALKVDGSWAESAVTWSNQPVTSGAAATSSSGAGWREWNVATQVQAMYSTANNGFLHPRRDREPGRREQQYNEPREGLGHPATGRPVQARLGPETRADGRLGSSPGS